MPKDKYTLSKEFKAKWKELLKAAKAGTFKAKYTQSDTIH